MKIKIAFITFWIFLLLGGTMSAQQISNINSLPVCWQLASGMDSMIMQNFYIGYGKGGSAFVVPMGFVDNSGQPVKITEGNVPCDNNVSSGGGGADTIIINLEGCRDTIIRIDTTYFISYDTTLIACNLGACAPGNAICEGDSVYVITFADCSTARLPIKGAEPICSGAMLPDTILNDCPNKMLTFDITGNNTPCTDESTSYHLVSSGPGMQTDSGFVSLNTNGTGIYFPYDTLTVLDSFEVEMRCCCKPCGSAWYYIMPPEDIDPNTNSIIIDDSDGNDIVSSLGGEDCNGNTDPTDCGRTYVVDWNGISCDGNTQTDIADIQITCGGISFDWSGSGVTLSAAEQTATEAEFSAGTFPDFSHDKEAVIGVIGDALGADCDFWEFDFATTFITEQCTDGGEEARDTVPIFLEEETHTQIVAVEKDADGSLIAVDYLYKVFIVEPSECLEDVEDNHGWRSSLVNMIGKQGTGDEGNRTIQLDKAGPVTNGKYDLWVHNQNNQEIQLFRRNATPCYWDATEGDYVYDYDLIEAFGYSQTNTNMLTGSSIVNEFEIDPLLRPNGKPAFFGTGSTATRQLYYYHFNGTNWVNDLVSNSATAFSGAIHPVDGDPLGLNCPIGATYRGSTAGNFAGLEIASNGDLIGAINNLRDAVNISQTSAVVKFTYSGAATLPDRINGCNYTWNIIAGSANGYTDGTGTAAQFFFGAPSSEILIDEDAAVETYYLADYFNNRIRKIELNGGASADISDNYTVTTVLGSGAIGTADGTGTAATLRQPHELENFDANTRIVTDRTTIRLVDKATWTTQKIEGEASGTTQTTTGY